MNDDVRIGLEMEGKGHVGHERGVRSEREVTQEVEKGVGMGTSAMEELSGNIVSKEISDEVIEGNEGEVEERLQEEEVPGRIGESQGNGLRWDDDSRGELELSDSDMS